MEKFICILTILFLLNGCISQQENFDGVQREEMDDLPDVSENAREPEPETIEEPAVEGEDEITEQGNAIPVENEVGQEETRGGEVAEAPFEVFEPELTYSGAYNGPLYGTSEQFGGTNPDDAYFENLNRNGVNYFIGMFALNGKPDKETLVNNEGLGLVVDAIRKHPYRVVPFFNPGLGGEEVEPYVGAKLTGWYKETLAAVKEDFGEDFIRGMGEIETQEWQVRHSDSKVLQLFAFANENKIHAMFHPVSAKLSDVETIIEKYPGTTFLIHMYNEDARNGKSKLIELLKTHDNLYYSIDAAHIIHYNNMDILYDYETSSIERSKSRFISTYDANEKSLLNAAVAVFKPIVDAAPDKIMWGTEAGPTYNFEPEVYDRIIKFSRLFIGKLEVEDQEKVGYKNALRVFGEGVRLDEEVTVYDAKDLGECTDEQLDFCPEECNIADQDNDLTPEQEFCEVNCRIKQLCFDPESDEEN